MPAATWTGFDFFGIDNPEPRDRFTLDLHRCDHRCIIFFEHVDHLPQRRHLGIDNIVSKQSRERLVARKIFRLVNGMAETEGLALPRVAYPSHLGYCPDLAKQIVLTLFF